jgi:hypothetical protein
MGSRCNSYVGDVTAGKEDGGGENGTFNQMLVELELNDIAYHVYTDYAEVKRDWDSRMTGEWNSVTYLHWQMLRTQMLRGHR